VITRRESGRGAVAGRFSEKVRAHSPAGSPVNILRAAFSGESTAVNLRRLTAQTFQPPLMTHWLLVETRIAVTLYSLGEFRYMRNIGGLFRRSSPSGYPIENLVASQV
jgi:hypothetical protein